MKRQYSYWDKKTNFFDKDVKDYWFYIILLTSLTLFIICLA